MTQGPAIRNSGRVIPTSKSQSFITLLARWYSTAALMKLVNNGWPSRGCEVNSGWNWQPMNQG